MKINLIIQPNNKKLLQKIISLLPPNVRIQTAVSKKETAKICIIEKGALSYSEIKKLSKQSKIIIIVNIAKSLEFVEAMSAGAVDVIPVNEIEKSLPNAINLLIHRIQEEKDISTLDLENLVPCASCAIVGESYVIQKLCKDIVLAAETDAPVFITGETGTGKELVAESITDLSNFTKPFEIINCAAIPENLLEAELFGYEKGAFTSAINSKPGRLLLADKGTVFFDEIGELPLTLQGKLLRFMQTQTFHPIGATKEVQVKVRVITATNKDLKKMVNEEKFREDLYYRISVINICLSPLRERKQDISSLAQCFILRYSSEIGKKIKGISNSFVKTLQDYNWPGNIRQLENVIRSAIAKTRADILTTYDLPTLTEFKTLPSKEEKEKEKELIIQNLSEYAVNNHSANSYQWLIGKIEQQLLDKALDKAKDNQSQAAKILGISRLTLRKKISEKNNN